MEHPLITFLLVAYNQERFIKEAVEGAFSQSYSPLEIILSDDCSTDRTFEIIKDLAAAYVGPHRIILNRNVKNLGIGEHLNCCMKLSNGELIVGAAGDDISFPERTVEIYRAWIGSGKKAFSIDSLYEKINENGSSVASPQLKCFPKEQQLLYFSKTLATYVQGCTHAWHRKVFDVFGPLPNITFEDVAIPPRSMLLGKVVRINKPLVKYRKHQNNVWVSAKVFSTIEGIDRIVYYSSHHIKICADVIRCITEYKSAVKDSSHVVELDNCISNIYISSNRLALKKDILTGYPIIRLYSLFKYLYLYGWPQTERYLIIFAISKKLYVLARKIKDVSVIEKVR